MSYNPHFRRFLAADPERLHLAAHSHQCWSPSRRRSSAGSTRLGWQTASGRQCSARSSPRAQRHVAEILHLPPSGHHLRGPNTHGFVRGDGLPQLARDQEVIGVVQPDIAKYWQVTEEFLGQLNRAQISAALDEAK